MDDLISHSSDNIDCVKTLGTFAEHVLQIAIVSSSETVKSLDTVDNMFGQWKQLLASFIGYNFNIYQTI